MATRNIPLSNIPTTSIPMTITGGNNASNQSTRTLNKKTPQTLSISDSYRKMGFGEIGGLGGRMGELEKASLRLGEAAAGRRLKEQKEEYGYQSRLQAQKAKQEQQLARMSRG